MEREGSIEITQVQQILDELDILSRTNTKGGKKAGSRMNPIAPSSADLTQF